MGGGHEGRGHEGRGYEGGGHEGVEHEGETVLNYFLIVIFSNCNFNNKHTKLSVIEYLKRLKIV